MTGNSVSIIVLLSLLLFSSCRNSTSFGHYEVVSANSIVNTDPGTLNSIPIGNGKFTFIADISGLQSFPYFYTGVNSLSTKSEWFRNTAAHNQLGLIGLYIVKKDGNEISIRDISNPLQKLDLWTGEIDSRFDIEGVPVHLQTVCHPDYDMISVKIISELIREKKIRIKMSFSEDSLYRQQPSVSGLRDDYSTTIIPDTNSLTIFNRNNSNNKYEVIVWRNHAELSKVTDDLYYFTPVNVDSVYSFSCQFLNIPQNGRVQTFGETEAASRKYWMDFWNISITSLSNKEIQDKKYTEQIIRSKYLNKLNLKWKFLN
jgi:hypothetical protein